MLYCRMFVEWFSQKWLDHFSYPASIAQRQSRRNSANTNGRTPTNHGTILHTTMMTTTHSTSRRSDSGTKHLQGGDTCQESARPHANSKKTKPYSSTNARHGMRSAGCVECPSTTRRQRTPPMIHSISITSIPSRSTPSCSSTQQASNPATPAATDSEATKTHQHQSAHSQDNG